MSKLPERSPKYHTATVGALSTPVWLTTSVIRKFPGVCSLLKGELAAPRGFASGLPVSETGALLHATRQLTAWPNFAKQLTKYD
jgi:hypothetical protein